MIDQNLNKEAIDSIWEQWLAGLITRMERNIKISQILTNDSVEETQRLYDKTWALERMLNEKQPIETDSSGVDSPT